MKHKAIYFVINAILLVSVICLLYFKNLNLGIDFTGGLVVGISSEDSKNSSELREFLEKEGFLGVSLQNFQNSNDIILRLQIDPQKKSTEQINLIQEKLRLFFNNKVTFNAIDYVGPRVGQELVIDGLLATVTALVLMMLYIWFRFDFNFGIGAFFALLYDLVFMMGFYSFTQIEFNITSIAAILTVLGYSINDSVVIFDRVRENAVKYKAKSLSEIVNLSINETLSRTFMTLVTTAVACLALIFSGASVIFGFSLAILVGIIFGTYSSICISCPLVLVKNKNT